MLAEFYEREVEITSDVILCSTIISLSTIAATLAFVP